MTKKWLPIDQAHVKKYLLNRLIKGGTFQKKNLDTSSYNFTRENHRNKIYLLIRRENLTSICYSLEPFYIV